MICGQSSWDGWLRYWLSVRAAPPARPMRTTPPSRGRRLSPWPSLRRALLPLLIGLALNGCSTKPNSDVNGCDLLTVRVYPQHVQKTVAEEMRASGQNTYWPEWISDYGTLRAEVRACRSVKP